MKFKLSFLSIPLLVIAVFLGLVGISRAFTGPTDDPPGGSGAITVPIEILYGGTGASTSANARTNLAAAASQANSDITSLTPGVSGSIFTINQNSVAVFSSEWTNAVANTLYLKAGGVGIGNVDPGAYKLKVTGDANITGALTVGSCTGCGSGGAPIGAGYITKTPDATLTDEQALSTLATGYMKVTTGTGAVTSQAVPIPLDEGGTGTLTGSITGTGALAFTSGGSATVALKPGVNGTAAIQLQNASGASILNVNTISSRVGIGPGFTSVPATTVEILGDLTVSASAGDGAGKINVGTVDPPYTINGKGYATYLPSMTGVKEETAGVLDLDCAHEVCKREINFASEKEGSDLWLFAKTTNLKNNFDNMVVLITPSFDGKVWYQKDVANSRLTVFASPVKIASNSVEVSYRLTAPRFDFADWPNIRKNSTIPGFIIN